MPVWPVLLRPSHSSRFRTLWVESLVSDTQTQLRSLGPWTACCQLSLPVLFLAVLCAERVGQMTKTYNDIDAVTRLLEEVSVCVWGGRAVWRGWILMGSLSVSGRSLPLGPCRIQPNGFVLLSILRQALTM